MHNSNDNIRSEIIRRSGVNPVKCMRCGKCTATCPAFDTMEYHPHQFVYMVESGDIEIVFCRQFLTYCKIVGKVILQFMHVKTYDDLIRQYGVVVVPTLERKSTLLNDLEGMQRSAILLAGIVVYPCQHCVYCVIVETEVTPVYAVAEVEFLFVAHII